MFLAKSYQGLPQLSEPYEKAGKKYIDVQLKSGKSKSVRVYTEKEYNKMYPEAIVDDPYKKFQKDTLGFTKGYITIFSGVKAEHTEWFEQSICRHCRHWGWYITSEEEVPNDLPPQVTPLVMNWEIVSDNPDKLPDDAETAKRVVRFRNKRS